MCGWFRQDRVTFSTSERVSRCVLVAHRGHGAASTSNLSANQQKPVPTHSNLLSVWTCSPTVANLNYFTLIPTTDHMFLLLVLQTSVPMSLSGQRHGEQKLHECWRRHYGWKRDKPRVGENLTQNLLMWHFYSHWLQVNIKTSFKNSWNLQKRSFKKKKNQTIFCLRIHMKKLDWNNPDWGYSHQKET